MAVESAADRAAFLSTDDFGVAAALNGGPAIAGIFDRETYDALTDGGAPVEASVVMFTGRTADLSDAAIGDTLTVDSVDWLVTSVRPDGAGMTVLRLEEAA